MRDTKKIPKNDNITYERYLNGNYVESMFIEPVTEYELQIEINNLSETKSAGHDDISAKMIKIISEEIIKPLTYIYNLSFETGKIGTRRVHVSAKKLDSHFVFS